MAISQTEANIVLGSKQNAKQATVGIPAGPDGEDPGLLFLESVDSGATTYAGLYLWADSSHVLRYSTSKPTNEDSSGSVLDATTAASAANKALSNLSSVAVNCDVVSDTDSTDDLGSSSIYWAESYIDKMYLNSTAYLDGSSAGNVVVRGNIVLGVSGTGADLTLYGDNYDVVWDASDDRLEFGDSAILGFGASNDIVMFHDGTDTHIDGGAGDDILKIGDTATIDLWICGANDDIIFDASADKMMFTDTCLLSFGTGLAADGDINLAYASAGTLSWTQQSSGIGSILKGEDDKGIDETWYAESASDYMKWDQDGGTGNLGSLLFEDSVIEIAGANATYEIGISTSELLFNATDHGDAGITFGSSSGTNSIDVTFQTQTAGDYVVFDAGAKTFTFTDVSPVMADDDLMLFGSAAGGDISIAWQNSGSTLDICQVTDGTGSVDFIDLPVLLTGANDAGTLLTIAGIDTTSNTDTVLIDHSGDGYAINIDLNEATSDGINIEAFTNHTVPLIRLDGDTAGFLGASNIGMLTILNDIALTSVNSSALVIDVGATKPIDAAEGYCLRIIDTSVVATTPPAYAVYVDATANEGMAIETRAAAAKNLVLMGVAGQTDSMLHIDGGTGAGWDGADGVGMVQLNGDGAHAHANASLLNIVDATGASIASGRGTSLRIIDTTTVGADSWVAYIDTTANDGLLIDTGHADSINLKLTGLQAQVASMAVIDGSTGTGWDGADNVGMLHLVSDSAHVDAGATMLYVANSTQSIAAAEGNLARFINTGAAQADASMIEITAKDETEYAITVTAGISNFEAHGIMTAFGGGTDLTGTPTAAEFTGEFTATALSRPGFIGVAEDSGSNVNYLVVSDGTTWHYIALTAAS